MSKMFLKKERKNFFFSFSYQDPHFRLTGVHLGQMIR